VSDLVDQHRHDHHRGHGFDQQDNQHALAGSREAPTVVAG
jgi:hypothetical protein